MTPDSAIWRTGRKVGRTIYRQIGKEPSDGDKLIGVVDNPALARLVVHAVNTLRENDGRTRGDRLGEQWGDHA